MCKLVYTLEKNNTAPLNYILYMLIPPEPLSFTATLVCTYSMKIGASGGCSSPSRVAHASSWCAGENVAANPLTWRQRTTIAHQVAEGIKIYFPMFTCNQVL